MLAVKTAPCLLLFRLAVGLGPVYDPETGFALGVYGPITTITQDDLATAVLFDLDFRKNTEPAVRERFGPPIVEVPNMHPDLKFKVQIGVSNSEKTTGVSTALDWLYGLNGSQKVVGIAGGYHSPIGMPIASNCEVFKTPQVAWGSSARILSDKTLYPWFLRTFAPDNFQGLAMWAWMQFTEVPSVIFFYRSLEVYGEGLFQVTFEQASAIGQSSRVQGLTVPITGDLEEDRTTMIAMCADLKALSTKFVIILFADPAYATLAMYGMEQQEMFYGSHQILGGDSFGIVDTYAYKPSRGYPQGCMHYTPVTAGDRHPLFVDTWRRMTPEDVYGPEARERYLIDKFKIPLEAASTNKLEQSDFTDRTPWIFSNFILDAAYSFVLAINNLLNAGHLPSQVHGEVLLEELKTLSFEGVTGRVAFDSNQDRVANWELWNVKETGGHMESVAYWLVAETDVNKSFQFHGRRELMWTNGMASLQAPKELTACQLGYRWDDSGLCILCQVNERAMLTPSGDPSCQPCGLGSVSDRPLGALNCTDCPPGSYRDGSVSGCTSCARGTFMDGSGASACKECPAGRYTEVEGASMCTSCGGEQASRFTTMERVLDSSGQQTLTLKLGASSAHFCGCRQSYRPDGMGGCIECQEGMLCQGMNETAIQRGYYADFISADGGLSVYKCFGDEERCPGGPPGYTCAPGRHGLSCSECKDGKTPKDGGSCVDCKGTDVGPFIAVLMVTLLAMIFAYHLIDTQNRLTQSHALLLAGCAVGQLVTLTQQLGVIGKLAATWEEPITSLMEVLQVLALDLEILRLNCVSNVNPWERFSIKVGVIFITIGIMQLIHIGFVSLRHKCQWWQRMHTLVGAVGLVYMVFNIAVTSVVLEPFQCEQHPNGKWTVRPYPSVICWGSDDDHTRMVVGGAVAFILVPVFFLSACYVIVKQFPRRMRMCDTAFLKSFSFLFLRYRASQHWYVFYQLVRNFSVALVLLIPDAALQVTSLTVVLLIGSATTLHLWPWRVYYANIMDCLFGGCAIMVACLAGLFLNGDQKHLKGTSWVIFFVICACLVAAPFAIGYGLYRRYCRSRKPFQFFLCHHKNGSGAFVRLLKLHLHESSQVKLKVFVDSDNLENLDRLFNHVGHDTENLIVTCTEMVFTRPWCVGEMCTAFAKKVSVMLLALPGYSLPDKDFIAELSERISDMDLLTENGMSVEIIAATLTWIPGRPTIVIPQTVRPQIMQAIVTKMLVKEAAVIADDFIGTKASQPGKDQVGQNMVLFDKTSMEAASSAFILIHLLTPHFAHDTKRIPLPVEDGSGIIESDCGVLLVVCTKGMFDRIAIIRFLLQTFETFVTFLPLICEQSFSVPRKDMATILQTGALSGAALSTAEIDTVSSLIASMFKEIAIHFDAQYFPINILEVAAQAVASRLNSAKPRGSSGTKHAYRDSNIGRENTSGSGKMRESTSATGSQGPLTPSTSQSAKLHPSLFHAAAPVPSTRSRGSWQVLL